MNQTTRIRALSASLLAMFGLLSGCAVSASDDGAGDSAESLGTTSEPLIGGSQAQPGQFDATIRIPGCTAARVGPRHILTAAHCVMSLKTGQAYYTTGSVIRVTNAKVFDSTAVWTDMTLDAPPKVHPVWGLECRDGCPNNTSAVAPYAPDIAIITTTTSLPSNIPQAFIDIASVPASTVVTLTGSGCEEYVGGPNPTTGRLKLQATYTQALAPASWDARYVGTYGKDQLSWSASLCPGDSGGPLYRGNSGSVQRVVGVNAYYTFNDSSGVSYQNTHTRMSGQPYVIGDVYWPSVVSWLRSIVPSDRFVQ
jgi:hypothetical protein